MRLGALLAGLAVAAGAFGAHALRDTIDLHAMEQFRTAVLYQMLHGIAIVSIAGGMSHFDRDRLGLACLLLAVGTALFSGSLYLLALTGVRIAGLIAPIGGLSLLAGWGAAILGARKLPRETPASQQSQQ